MSFPYINAYQQFFDSSGDPLVSGTIEFRDPTTNGLINSYPTADDADAQTNANANPLTLSATGAASAGLFLEDGVAYKVILKDAAGNTVATHDDVRCPIALPYLTTAAETAASATVVNVEYPPGNVLRYGTNTTPGTTDMTTALTNAINSGHRVYIPDGTYLLSTIGAQTFTKDIHITGESTSGAILDGNNDQDFSTDYDTSKIYLKNLTLQNFDNAITTPSSTSKSVTDVDIQDCWFLNIDEKAIYIRTDTLNRFRVSNNRFDTIGGTADSGAIWAVESSSTANEVTAQDTKQNFIITNNYFKDIVCTTNGGEAHAIIIWGRYATISGNIIENVRNNDYTSDNEGIYTKCRFVNISDNVLTDAGWNQGSITIKGAQRGAVSTGQGFSNIISGNVIRFTNVTNNSTGVYINCSDIKISDNRIEDAAYGVRSQEAVDSGNVVITDNVILNAEIAGIYLLESNGEGVDISGNIIDKITGTGQASAWGIYILPGNVLETCRITNNRIFIDACAATGTVRGMFIAGASGLAMSDLFVDGNMVDINDDATTVQGIRLNFADITNAVITNNNIKLSSSEDANDELSIANTSRPTYYKIIGNGDYPDESNAQNFVGKSAYRYVYTTDPNGTITIGYLPLNAVVTKSYYHVAVAPLTATDMAFSITTDDVNGIKAATAIADASWNVGWHDAIQDGAMANVAEKVTGTTSAVAVRLTGSDLTAGDVTLYLEYVIQQG